MDSAAAVQGLERVVPFVDLGRLHSELAGQLEEAYHRVVAEGGFILSPELERFERSFASYIGVDHAIGVGSGTDALHFALRALGVGPGDEVITAVNTFAATAEAILMAGARPVFVDVDEDTLLMDLDAVEAEITARTRAIIPVHLHGQPVDMKRLGEIARRAGVSIVEDACQAHGAFSGALRAGAVGDAGCFSFYPSKNLGALGDGGIVTTNDAALATRVRSLRSHGEDANRLHVELGYCSRLHGLQAGFLSVKLPLLDRCNAMRAASAALYDQLLAPLGITLPGRAPGVSHVFHLYVIRTRDRDRMRAALAERGVQTGVHYAVPLHLEPAFAYLGYREGQFPIAEAAAASMISLPMYPFLQDEEVTYVADAVGEVARV